MSDTNNSNCNNTLCLNECISRASNIGLLTGLALGAGITFAFMYAFPRKPEKSFQESAKEFFKEW